MVIGAGSILLAALLLVGAMQHAARAFDVRRHLATKTRYAYRLGIPSAPSAYQLPDPEGYEAVHLYLLARHGTRWPTADRMKQINSLEGLFRDARNTNDHPWIRNWTAPFTDINFSAGELHSIGADELWGLAYRLRRRYPSLAKQLYFPKRFPIVSTQVSRTAASASAFASAFFPGVDTVDPRDRPADVDPGQTDAAGGASISGGRHRSSLREVHALHQQLTAPCDEALDASLTDQPAVRRPQAFAIGMAPKLRDPLLRFFDMCPAYAQHDEFTEKWIGSWMQGNWSLLLPALEQRLQLSRDMNPCEVEALWQLCLLEAGLFGIVHQACSLFRPEEVVVLEWIDDVHLIETQSYGAGINYEIAAPLLADVATTLRAVAEQQEAPAARLLFAHCETLVPLATLLGLFRPQHPASPDASAEAIDAVVSPRSAQRHLAQLDALEDLQLMVQGVRSAAALSSEDAHVCYKGKPLNPGDTVPPPEGWQPMIGPDDARLFKGARLAPYGANLALVVYRRTAAGDAITGRPKHLVRLLYNEQVVPIPGCSGGSSSGMDCDLESFLELVSDRISPDALERLCGVGGASAAAAAAAGQGATAAR